MPSATDTANLPSGSSRTLELVQANPAEVIQSTINNAITWQGQLSIEGYLQREARLRDTDLTRNGAITAWILVDTADPPPVNGIRRILASCETLKKRALVARSNSDVKEVVTHGIGSVFCSPAFRGKGYAQRMLEEVGKILDTWQQKEGENGEFTALWSDIGKVCQMVPSSCGARNVDQQQRFYARLGWAVFPSTHVSLPPKSDSDRSFDLSSVEILASEDLGELCKIDEASLRATMAKPTSASVDVRVALVPDIATMRWHHAREEYLGETLHKRFPYHKGALAKTPDGRRVWCTWTRTFGATQDENVLNILRLVIEAEDGVGGPSIKPIVESDRDAMENAIAAILEQAQLEAFNWGMKRVELWNPSPSTISAAKKIDPAINVVDRIDESITSLRWHGKPLPAGTKIEWIANEKFGWC